MRILVIGAAGRTGRLLVEQALGHGHQVRALVHVTALDVAHGRLEVVRGDVLRFADVEHAVAGVDAVLFVVGATGATAGVHSQGVANVMHAMAASDVEVLVVASAGGVFARGDHRLSLPFRALIALTLRKTYDDLERMEQLVAASGLAWTIVRLGGLSDGEQTGDYRVSADGSLLSKPSRLPRADAAAFMLKAAETGSFTGRTVFITG